MVFSIGLAWKIPNDGISHVSMHREVASEDRPAVTAWRVVGLLSAAFAINYADRQFLFSAFPRVAGDLRLDDFQLGLAGSLFTWSYAVFMPASGWIADRYSRSTLIVFSITLWSLACLGTALSNSVTQLLTSRVVMGISESLYVPSAIRLIAEHHSGRTRSRALSVHAFAQFAGICFGGFYGGWSADHIGWRRGYELLCILGLLHAFVLQRYVRTARNKKITGFRSEASLFRLLRCPLYYVLSLSFFAFCALLWVIYAWTPTVLHYRFGLSLTTSGIDATVPLQSGAAIGVLVGGCIGDLAAIRRVAGRLEVSTIGLLLCVPFSCLIFAARSAIKFEVSAFMFGLCSSLFVANVFASLYDVVPLDTFSFATGVVNMIGGLGGGAAILCAGAVRNHGGIAGLMLWISGATAAIAISLLLCTWMLFAGRRKVQPAPWLNDNETGS